MLEKLKSKVRLKITGKNIERFIHRLYHHHIEILNLKDIDYKTVVITVYEKDYKAVLDLKTIYEIDCIGDSGMIAVKRKLKMNRIFFVVLIFAFFLLYALSNVIFEIEIVHTNKELRTLLYKELEEHGIHKKSIKKSFKQLEQIKTKIVNENRDKIEWLEIEAVGTKYVVRVEMRKIKEPIKEASKRHVVAKKSAIIRQVEATKGEIIRNKNDYVDAGDIIISGNLKLNEENKETVAAEGKVYGEVWYKVTVSYPFAYRETRKTGKKQTAYTVQFLNYTIQLFPFHHYQTKITKKNPFLKHSFLPIYFSQETQFETIEIDEMNTEDEAIHKAKDLAFQKMESQLSDNEKIINGKNLKVEVKDSRIVLEVFFTVLEDITSYQNIVDEIESK